MTANYPYNPTDTEIYNYRYKLNSILFLLLSYEGKHKKIIQYLKEDAKKGRENFPTSISGMYDLMVRTSGQFDISKRGFRKQQ